MPERNEFNLYGQTNAASEFTYDCNCGPSFKMNA